MIDGILSHHMDPMTCGVAKFNWRLAKELGVNCWPLQRAAFATHPLVSIKPEECPLRTLPGFLPGTFDLFLHGWNDVAMDRDWLLKARPLRVYAANAVIASAVRAIRSDVIMAWCPATLSARRPAGALQILTFGMAHKVLREHHVTLRALLEASGQDYTVSISTGVHEGSPMHALSEAAGTLEIIYRDRLRVCGYLADDALAEAVQSCDAVAVFFDPALRANHTSFWAAVGAGKPVITNLDAESPRVDGVLELAALRSWPTVLPTTTLPAQYSWAALKGVLHAAPVLAPL